MFSLFPPKPAPPHCIILAIDDATFGEMGGVREYRSMLAKSLELLAPGASQGGGRRHGAGGQGGSIEDDPLERAMRGHQESGAGCALDGSALGASTTAFRACGGCALGTIKPTNFRTTASPDRFRSKQRTATGTALVALRWKLFGWRKANAFSNLPTTFKSDTELIPAARTKDGNRPLARSLFARSDSPGLLKGAER